MSVPSLSTGDLYPSWAQENPRSVAPAADTASAAGMNPAQGGKAPAFALVGFLLALVLLRVVIEVQGETT